MNVHVIETQAFWRRYYLKEEREKRLKNKRLKNCPRKHKIYIYIYIYILLKLLDGGCPCDDNPNPDMYPVNTELLFRVPTSLSHGPRFLPLDSVYPFDLPF